MFDASTIKVFIASTNDLEADATPELGCHQQAVAGSGGCAGVRQCGAAEDLTSNTKVELGYWAGQKTLQYDGFFGYLDTRIVQDGLRQEDGPTVEYFEFRNGADFQLPG